MSEKRFQRRRLVVAAWLVTVALQGAIVAFQAVNLNLQRENYALQLQVREALHHAR